MSLARKSFALALALAPFLAACGSDDPAALLTSARGYMAKRDYNASVIQLKNVLQKAPDNSEARYLLGLAFLEQGDATAARIELDKAAQLGFAADDIQVALARAALARGEADRVLKEFGSMKLGAAKAQAELRSVTGMAHLARNERKEAERAFEEALTHDRSNIRANLGMARLSAAERKVPEALARVEQVLAGDSKNLEALGLKADLLAVDGDAGATEQAYRAAIAAAPKDLGPRMSLVMHLLRQGALEKASSEAAAMQEIAPKDARSSYARAVVLVEQKQFGPAREAIQQVLKVAPEHVPSLALAGMAALQTGALQEAENHLRKAVFNAPQATGVKRLLATTHLRMGKTDLALEEVGELLKVASQDPATEALAGEVHLANGDVARAARHYERAKSLAPNDAGMQTRLAQIHLASGDAQRGIGELEAASAGNQSAYQADLALIANYLRARDANKALEAVTTLEKKQPNNPLTHHLRGVALLLKKDTSGARASFGKALALQPTYMPAVSGLAQLDMQDKKPQAARERYEAVLKKEPNNEQALVGLAVVLRVTGASAQEIEKPLRQSVTANPSSPNARIVLINYYLRARDFKAALAAAQDAHAALPGNTSIVQALGRTQIAAGEPRQAVSTFTRLVELQPKSPEPQLLLAQAHMASKQPDEAIKALRAALGIRPDLAAAQRDIAAIYVATGRHDQALREAKDLQADRPQDPIGFVVEGEIYLAQKKLDQAEKTYRAALKKFDLPALVMRTHSILEASGKRAEAEALTEDWIRRQPKDAAVLAYLADRDIGAKRYDSAEARYRRALELTPDNALFLNNLAWVSYELKRPKSLEYAERAYELAPQQPAVMDTLGMILVGSGQTERGLELLGRAAELAPDAHQIRLNFAKALIKAERRAAARKELEQLARLDAKLPVQQEAAKLLAAL